MSSLISVTTMKNSKLLSVLLLHIFLIFSISMKRTTASTSSSPSSPLEVEVLLSFKSSLKDPSSSLSNWSPNSSSNPCNWTGISCSESLVTSIDLQNLKLSGEISSSVCQLNQLANFNLANNFFNQPIPLHLSECKSLQTLNLSSNLLWGTVPDQIYQLSFLKVLDLSGNKIEGQVPVGLGTLKELQVLNLGNNLFSGTIHSSLFSNLSELVILDLSQNPSISSQLPQEIGNLKKLKRFFMQNCGLYGNIPDSVINLGELEVLDMSMNNLTGKIPHGFGLGVKFVSVDLSQNALSGSFPNDICYGKSLIELSLHSNYFTGALPSSIVKCRSLERFEIRDNGFAGVFPSALWLLPNIRHIRAENNRFSGSIPDNIGVSSRLEQVQIDNNSFAGEIPHTLGQINTLYRFSASLNRFYGNLPDNFCDSPVMSIINLSHNYLSGPIPEVRNCKRLVSLSLADNDFTGEIPNSLARLPVLTYIDLSKNNLSGGIPQDLQNLKLALLNVSFNQLSGSVPSSLISGLPASFLEGNAGLCGPGLPNSCDTAHEKKNSRSNHLIVGVVASSFTVALLFLGGGLFAVYRLYRRKTRPNSWKILLFYPLKITEEDILMSLNEKNCIGQGPFGDVYMIRLPTGEVTAVKKLSTSRKISFGTVKSELKKLAKARHRNIVKISGFCYSESSILVIHEYIRKGSLGDILSRSNFSMEWNARLRIALGAARGLHYLHKIGVPCLLHRNIKANNILLDEEFEAKITGFGYDRAIGEASYKLTLQSESASHCYIAPEDSCSKKATEQMDVFGFGVVLLQLISGRRAPKLDSKESLDIVKWVRRKINTTDGNLQIFDPEISASSKMEMQEALELALLCISVMPEKRPTMDEVVRSLQSIQTRAYPPKNSFSEMPSSSDH